MSIPPNSMFVKPITRHMGSFNSGKRFGNIAHPFTEVIPSEFVLKNYSWSPILFHKEYRAKANFIVSHYCALDFDDGLTPINVAVNNLFCDMAHFIGTSQSHTASHPKFRVLIPWEHSIEDVYQYEQNMRRVIDHYGADMKCKDGGRFFFACRDIVSVSHEGYGMEVRAYGPPPPQEVLTRPTTRIPLPLWAAAQFEQTIPHHSRNSVVFGVTKDFFKSGFSLDEALTMIPRLKLEQPSHDPVSPERVAGWICLTWKRLERELNGKGG
jgi:hypothetical protein